ncbi:MAG: AlkZ family DNA glycosylase [Prolixibacteraceae bacterium]|nr:AlkZ family DNA glycosylase [Prolixibacteraceae bacterium]
MNFQEISKYRLTNQHLSVKKVTAVKELVKYMGAMQAQDYAMAQIAVGKRLDKVTGNEVNLAMNNGEILRTHLLRPTWHLVSADDIYWMLQLTAPHIKTLTQSRHKELDLTEKSLSKIFVLIEKVLLNNNHLTRSELYSAFHESKISTENNRGAHILMSAELEGIICSGRITNGQQTFALLEERFPKPMSISRDEALEKLARIYFESRWPATLRDFVWWSGLPVKDARKAMDMIGNDFTAEKIEEVTYLIPNSLPVFSENADSVFLLPAFDEYLIAYTDRKAVVENNKMVVSKNGIFWPIIVVNGQVVGLWKRTIKKDKVTVTIDPFMPLKKRQINLIEQEVSKLGDFLGKTAELTKQ